MTNKIPKPITPSRWVKGAVLFAMSGYTKDAQNHKRNMGVWIEGRHWLKAPDGNILYNPCEIDKWVEGYYSE